MGEHLKNTNKSETRTVYINSKLKHKIHVKYFNHVFYCCTFLTDVSCYLKKI